MGYHWKNIITNRTIRYTFSSVWRSTTYCTSPQQPHLRQLFGSMEGSLGTNGLQARTTEPRPTHPSNIQTLAFRCFRMRTKNIKNKATKPNKMVVEGTKYAVLVWNPDSETSCFCFNIYMAEAHPSLCQARCQEGISILDQLMVTDHLEVSEISPKISSIWYTYVESLHFGKLEWPLIWCSYQLSKKLLSIGMDHPCEFLRTPQRRNFEWQASASAEFDSRLKRLQSNVRYVRMVQLQCLCQRTPLDWRLTCKKIEAWKEIKAKFQIPFVRHYQWSYQVQGHGSKKNVRDQKNHLRDQKRIN